MSGFARDWLALRAPYDAAARSVALAREFAAALPARPRIVDLAAGDGANRRWLDARLPPATRWTLADNDPALIDGVADAQLLDLATELERIGDFDAATCSALLDLVSADWLGRFVAWLQGRPLLAALSIDGRVRFAPEDPEDSAILAAFAADQRRDKGFGPALGAEAPRYLAVLLRDGGYRVETASSDWVLGPGDEAMVTAMIDGFASVAKAREWAMRRWEQVQAGRLRLLVGHVDLLASQ
jgi:hypothetical protein